MTEAQPEAKYHWVVAFRDKGKLYTYMYRTVPDMAEIVRVHHDKYDKYPYRMWVIVDGEMQKVLIS